MHDCINVFEIGNEVRFKPDLKTPVKMQKKYVEIDYSLPSYAEERKFGDDARYATIQGAR